MKRFLLRGAALMLILCLMMPTALAVDATILRVDTEEEEANGFYTMIRDLAVVGDTVYLYGSMTDNTYATEILRWKPGMESAEPYISGLLFTRFFDKLDEAKVNVEDREMDVDVEHGVTKMFTDGERLLGLNHLNGKIFAITEKDGKPVFEDIVTLKDMTALYHQSEDYAYFISPESVICVSGKVLWQYSDWNDQTGENVRGVMAFDLKDGSVVKTSPENIISIVAYKDGKALMLSRSDENAWDEIKQAYRPMDMLSYDPATDKAKKIGEFSYQQWRPDYLLYSEAMDALVYNVDTRVMGLFNNLKEEKQVGYVPLSYASCCAILNDSLVISGNRDSGVIARTLSKDFKTDEYVNVLDGYMDKASRAFAEDYPQIPIYSVVGSNYDAVSIDLLMNAGADAPDIMQLNMDYSVYTKLAAKGYCADLSGYPKLAAFVNDLYPAYREAVTGPNGEIFAIPTRGYSYDGFFVNKAAMEDMGLTIDDIPTNLVELCAFITRWNDEFVEKFPNYNAVEYFSDYKKNMFNLMFNRYIAYCNATKQEVKFDTPVFREMISAMEAMETKELEASLKSPDPEKSDYKQPLIYCNSEVVGNWYDFNNEDSGTIFLPMGLTKDAGYYTGVNMWVMFLNPKSQHKEYAVKLMEYMIDGIYDSDAYTLLATKTEPLKNSYFDEWLESNQKQLEEMEKNLADAPEEMKADLQSMIADQKAYIERRTSQMQYTISPHAIEVYRETIMPYVYVSTPSFLDASEDAVTSEFNSLKQQYLDGKINIDKFIRDADGKLLMMQSE